MAIYNNNEDNECKVQFLNLKEVLERETIANMMEEGPVMRAGVDTARCAFWWSQWWSPSPSSSTPTRRSSGS